MKEPVRSQELIILFQVSSQSSCWLLMVVLGGEPPLCSGFSSGNANDFMQIKISLGLIFFHLENMGIERDD